MHDLDAIAIMQNRPGPVFPAHHVLVQFEGDSRWLQTQREDESFDGNAGGEFARFSV